MPSPYLPAILQGFVKEGPQVAALRASIFLVMPAPQTAALAYINFVPGKQSCQLLQLSRVKDSSMLCRLHAYLL